MDWLLYLKYIQSHGCSQCQINFSTKKAKEVSISSHVFTNAFHDYWYIYICNSLSHNSVHSLISVNKILQRYRQCCYSLQGNVAENETQVLFHNYLVLLSHWNERGPSFSVSYFYIFFTFYCLMQNLYQEVSKLKVKYESLQLSQRYVIS